MRIIGVHKHYGPGLKAPRKGHNSRTEQIVVFAFKDCAGVVLANLEPFRDEQTCPYGDS